MEILRVALWCGLCDKPLLAALAMHWGACKSYLFNCDFYELFSNCGSAKVEIVARQMIEACEKSLHEIRNQQLDLQLTCGRIQTTFFFRVRVRGVGGKSRSSCRPFAPRDNMPFSCRPFAVEPLELFTTSVDDRGRDIVEIWSTDAWRHGFV